VSVVSRGVTNLGLWSFEGCPAARETEVDRQIDIWIVFVLPVAQQITTKY
jgi:hypothetical protein